ncbi:type II toxin-antitoxin system RelE/ParE family toxin, partial [Mannheimia sp. E15BD]|uniref:type II toxin-antitoxin system RelE/ParE family toxin n=1 Tax=Mannheimia sp. E15BD TaxID=3278706 RepID=UPI00359E8565
IVQWSNEAEEQLNEKADYIAEQSSREIANNFFDNIKATTEKYHILQEHITTVNSINFPYLKAENLILYDL